MLQVNDLTQSCSEILNEMSGKKECNCSCLFFHLLACKVLNTLKDHKMNLLYLWSVGDASPLVPCGCKVTTKSSFDPRSAVGKRSSGWPERRSYRGMTGNIGVTRCMCLHTVTLTVYLSICHVAELFSCCLCRGMSGKVSITSARHWDFDCLRSMVAGLSLWASPRATGLKLRGIYPSTSCLRLGTESSSAQEMNKMIPQLPEYQISTKMLAFLAGEWRSKWDCREKCLRK